MDQASNQKRKFKLKDVAQEIKLALSTQIKNKSYNYVLDIDSEVEMDSFPGPLGQVLTNLFNNSITHGLKDKGEGTVSLRAVKDQDRVIITHRDTGEGISEEIIDKIFDPFFTTSRGKGGSGLGLSIVHNIVTGPLKGTLSVENNDGAIFTIVLPLDI